MSSFNGAFVARYAYFWCIGLFIASSIALSWARPRDPAPEFEFGGVASVVAIRSITTGKYLEVSLSDGLLRATAENPSKVAAKFRALVLGAALHRVRKSVSEYSQT